MPQIRMQPICIFFLIILFSFPLIPNTEAAPWWDHHDIIAQVTDVETINATRYYTIEILQAERSKEDRSPDSNIKEGQIFIVDKGSGDDLRINDYFEGKLIRFADEHSSSDSIIVKEVLTEFEAYWIIYNGEYYLTIFILVLIPIVAIIVLIRLRKNKKKNPN